MGQTRRTLASRADPHRLSERSVQAVRAEIDFVDGTYRAIRGRWASRLREDFCGTAQTSCEWVRRRAANVAVGLDLHADTLAWGDAHNRARLSPSQRRRLSLVERDAVHPGPAGAAMDIVLAMNFSYWVFTERRRLLAYFRAVRRSLRRHGLFMLDHWTGWETMKPHRESRRVGGFTYTWRMASFNPISARSVCQIGFRFPDGSNLPSAFTYDWRNWSIPEVTDALHDAGFRTVTVYWEADDGKGGGNGVFTPATVGEACASAIQFIVAAP